MKFLGNVATIIGLLFFLMLFFFGIVIVEYLVVTQILQYNKSNSVIELNLEDINYDYAGNINPWVTIFSENENVGLIDIIDAIEEAKKR
jgi:protease-4